MVSSVYDALLLLTPYDIDGSKLRIGDKHDGGYVLVGELLLGQPVLSFGIGQNYTFDNDMDARGHEVSMFDHTIERVEVDHKHSHFYREGVASETDVDKNLSSIQDHIRKHKIVGDDLILKMDVEGAEWDVLDKITGETLDKFSQIVVEFHWITKIDDVQFREKMVRVLSNINNKYTLCHVHGNNCGGYKFVNGFLVIDVLELTYVKTSLITTSPSKTSYPTQIDSANDPDRHDYILSFFPFLPSTDGADLKTVGDRVEHRRRIPKQQDSDATPVTESIQGSDDEVKVKAREFLRRLEFPDRPWKPLAGEIQSRLQCAHLHEQDLLRDGCGRRLRSVQEIDG